jgi:hypothetical protein
LIAEGVMSGVPVIFCRFIGPDRVVSPDGQDHGDAERDVLALGALPRGSTAAAGE